MENIQGGILKDILDLLARVSDSLVAWLGNADTDIADVKDVKKTKEGKTSDTFRFKVNLKQNSDGSKVLNYPYEIELELPKEEKSDTGSDIGDLQNQYADVPCKVTVWKNAEGEKKYSTKEDVLGKDFWTTTRDMLIDMLDEDTKQAFGIKGARTMKVRLQRICGAKETSVNLSAIVANYELVQAYADLDSLLTSDEFMGTLSDEPQTFQITETADDFDIVPADISIMEQAEFALNGLLCAAVQFQMDIQILKWYCAYNSNLFTVTGNLMWSANSWVDRFGMWYVEMTDSVCDTSQCHLAPVQLSDDSEADADIQLLTAVDNTITAYLEVLEQQYINLPHDMQREVDCLIRELKETKEISLKQAM